MHQDVIMISPRAHDDDEIVYTYISPWTVTNAGLWSLFAGATIFLVLRVWCKITRRHGLWYDDYILIVSWAILLANNALIIHEFATGYILKDSTESWDDRMHILINISSCGTVIGQALTKTAFGVTLLRLTKPWQQWILWFCMITMNLWAFFRCLFQWAKVCGQKSYQQWYRLAFCIGPTFRNDFKEGGNIYNVILDFVFAAFPWFITWSLDMRRIEKIGLCATMSLGMIVAIVSAVRINWKDDGNSRDPWYIYRNGISQVWYSSEVAGTIIVQCLPILRTLIREIRTTMTSKKLDSSYPSAAPKVISYVTTKGSNTAKGTSTYGSKTATFISKRNSMTTWSSDPEQGITSSKRGEVFALQEIPEGDDRTRHAEPDLVFQGTDNLNHSDSWPLPASQGSDNSRGSLSARSMEGENGMHSYLVFDSEEDGTTHGLSPPPSHRTRPTS